MTKDHVDRAEKQLAPGQRRVVTKSAKIGRHTVFDLYDAARGSYPGAVAGFGIVRQHHATEAEAQTEADRLNEFYLKGK